MRHYRTRYTGGIASIIFLVFYIDSIVRNIRGDSASEIVRMIVLDCRLWIFGLTTIFTFLLTTPGLLIFPSALIESIAFEKNRLSQSYLPLTDFRTWKKLIRSFVDAIGVPIAVFALLGLINYRSKQRVFHIAVFLMLSILVTMFGNSLMPRYLIMFIPVFSILAAEVLMGISRNYNHWIRKIGVVLILSVVLYALVYNLAGVITRFDETRIKAAYFIEEKIPKGSTIGIGYISNQFGWRIHKWRQPYIRMRNYTEVDFTNEPEYIVLSSYDIDEITRALDSGLMTEDYLWPEELDNWWYLYSSPSPSVFKTYVSLLRGEGYCLLASFRSRILAPIEFPPPDIIIYKKNLSENNAGCHL